MVRKKKAVYYSADHKPRHRWSTARITLLVVALAMIAGGGYLLLLAAAPILPVRTAIDLDTSDDAQDTRNRIQIPALNLEVPYYSDNTPATLERGVWWRFPDRGNPVKGGNFILSAHRFYLGKTPAGTRVRSPFYKLEKLQNGDKIRVFYEGEWYEYEVTNKYPVKPEDTKIEAETSEPRLTLYTCSLKGSADGRVVVEAKPLFENDLQKPPTSGSPLL